MNSKIAPSTNPSRAVAASGIVVAFANVTSNSGTWSGPFGYAENFGYQQDAWGIKLPGHRYYDPSTGRFLTRDPIKDGRNWDAFDAGEAAPTTMADPTGLMTSTMVALSLTNSEPDGPIPFGARGSSPSDNSVREKPDPVLDYINWLPKFVMDAVAPPHPGDFAEAASGMPFKDIDARRQIEQQLYEDPTGENSEGSNLTWYQDPRHWDTRYVPSWSGN